MVALVAMVALSAVAASSASAHEFYIEGKSMTELGLKEETVSSEIEGVTLSSVSGVEVICTETAGTGTIKAGGAGSMTLRFNKCSVATPVGCKVKSIVLENMASKLVEVEGKLADEFSPGKSGGILFVLPLEDLGASLCSQAGEWPIEGELTGRTGSEAEKEAGALNFTNTSGSHLLYRGSLLTVTGKGEVKLSGVNKGRKWSAKK